MPLYFQPWWLDAACGPERWGACVATDRGGEVTGLLPYHLKKRMVLPFVQMPPLTPYSGPLFFYPDHPDRRPYSQYTFEKKVSESLIAQLPRSVRFCQHFRPEVANWLAFQQAGFRQTTRYTFVIHTADKSIEELAQQTKSSVRNHLKNARQHLAVTVENDTAPDLFDRFCEHLRQKNLPPPCALPVFLRIHEAATAREQALCFVARDTLSRGVQAGLYLTLEPRRAGVLWSVVTPEGRATGALTLLLWAAVSTARQSGRTLDLEGSMDPGVEHLYRSLGGTMMPYFRVWKNLSW